MPDTPVNQNPFSGFSPEDRADIRGQLIQLRESGKLNDAQLGGVSRALGYLQPTGTTPETAPPIPRPRVDMLSQGAVGATLTGAAAKLPSFTDVMAPDFMQGGQMTDVVQQRRRQYDAMQNGILKRQLSLDQQNNGGTFEPVLEFTDKRFDNPQMREYLGMPKPKPMIEKAGDVTDAVVGTATGVQPVQAARDVGANMDSGSLLKSGTVGNIISEVGQGAAMMHNAGKPMDLSERMQKQAAPMPMPEPVVPKASELPGPPAPKAAPPVEAPKPEPKAAEPIAQLTKPPAEAPAPPKLDVKEIQSVPEVPKQPWEMNTHEYVTDRMADKVFSTEMKPEAKAEMYDRLEEDHKQIVEKALADGKPVPPEVAARYAETPAVPTPEQHIEQAGLISKGDIEGKVYMFEDPKNPGLTMSLKAEEITSPEAVRSAADLKIQANAAKAGPSDIEALKAKYGIKSETPAPVGGGSTAEPIAEPAPKIVEPVTKPIEAEVAETDKVVARAVDVLSKDKPISDNARAALEELTGVPLKDKSIEEMRHDLKGWQQARVYQRYLETIQDRANQVAQAAETPKASGTEQPAAPAKKTRTPRASKSLEYRGYKVEVGKTEVNVKAPDGTAVGRFSNIVDAQKEIERRATGWGAQRAADEAVKKAPAKEPAVPTVDAQLAHETKALEDGLIKENPALAREFSVIKSAAREAFKDTTGRASAYKEGLKVLAQNMDDPNRLKKAIDAASKKSEAGFIGGQRPAYSDAQLESMTRDHIEVQFSNWEMMSETMLAKRQVWEKLRSPQMERQIKLANDPLLTERWEALKSKAVRPQLEDPVKALARTIGGEQFTPADLTRMSLRERLGEVKRIAAQLEDQAKQVEKMFDKMSIKDSLKFIDNMELGRAQDTPGKQAVSDMLRQLLDSRRDAIIALGTGKFEFYLENYFPHVWQMAGKAQQMFQGYLAKRPLAGRADFLKTRDYQFFTDGIRDGLTPVSYNPVTLALIRVGEMDKYLMAHQALADLKDIGVVKWVADSQARKPDGYVPLQDKIFQPTRVVEGVGGHTRYGQYYAPRDAAAVIHNHLSPGLKGNVVYDAIRGYNNIVNQSTLGLSGFHAFEIMYDSFIGDMALGMRQLSDKRVAAGLRSIGRSLTLIGSGLDNLYQGNKMLQEYLSPGTHAQLTHLVDDVARSGGVAHMPVEYRNQAVNNIKRAAKEFQDAQGLQKVPPAASAAFNAVGAALQIASRPIMEWGVPRIKLGAFMKMAEDIHARLGQSAPPEVLTRELDKAWDAVDDRMGEVVYDNLFMNKVYKDIMHVTWRSYGWNMGTFRGIGGGLVDMARLGFENIKGGNPKMTYRAFYPLAMLAGTMYFSAVLGYAMTGKLPEEVMDYFYPKTGHIDSNGRPERVYGKSYMQDTIAWARHPIETLSHKAAPWMSQAYELIWANADYYGKEIRHTDDSPWQQAGQVGKYLYNSSKPFTLQNFAERQRAGGGFGTALASAFGIIPAPKWVGESSFEQYTLEHSKDLLPAGAKTEEQFQRSQEVLKVRNRMRQGMWTPKQAYDEAVRSGKISMDDYDQLIDEMAEKKVPIEKHFNKLPLDVALYGYVHYATPEERALVQDQLFDKLESKDPDTMTAKQNEMVQNLIKEAVKAPVARGKGN